jgi:O-antigen/teichoic acid export membrane protein
VRLIMLIALPFYFGLAATSEPLVLTLLGPKWIETIPLVHLLAFAMPFMTLQILFQPASNALGRAGLSLRIAMVGAAVMPICFLIGVQFGILGLAWGWLAGIPVFTALTMALALPAIGASLSALGKAIMPGLVASVAMAAAVTAMDSLLLPQMSAPARLAALVASGALIYGGLLMTFARPLVDDVVALIRRRPGPTAPAPA